MLTHERRGQPPNTVEAYADNVLRQKLGVTYANLRAIRTYRQSSTPDLKSV